MDNTFKAKALKAAILCAGIGISLQSAELTYNFLDEMSHQLGRAGLIAETFKFLLPLCALYAFRNKKRLLAVVLSAIALSLCAMSFTASYASLEKAFTQESKQSSMNLAIEEQIAALNEQAKAKEMVASTYNPVSHRTYFDKFTNEASELRKQVFELRKQQSEIRPESTVQAYSEYVSLGVSIIIELLTLATSLALGAITPRNTSNTPMNTCEEPSNDGASEDLDELPQNTLDFTSHKENADIKAAVISGVVEPTHRAIKSRFKGVGQNTIKGILDELRDEGVLIKTGRIYKRVSCI